MAHAIESRANSPANDLRDKLELAERYIVSLNAANIETFLRLLDQIEQQFEEFAQTDSDLRAEEGRWEGLLNRISAKAGKIVAAANQVGGLAKLRTANPPAENFWWHLDSEVVKRRTQTIRRALLSLITLVVVVGGGFWAIEYFFPPDPRAVLVVNTNGEVARLVAEGRWEDALTVVEAAQAELPNDAEMVVWEAVLAEQLGDEMRANAALDNLRQLTADNPINFWLLLGNHRVQVGNLAGAQVAAEEALAMDESNAQANFLLGEVAEASGNIGLAIEQFDRVFVLAEDSNPQLAVIARVRMGTLLQNPNSFSASEPITATEPVTP
jgi:tetratricopeptide (TPR) repeat protein